MSETVETPPTVYLVGAGPGDPDLLTIKAVRLLEQAEVVVYDRLVSDEVLKFIAPGATRIFAGKASRQQGMPQQEINELLVELAKKGRRVVRLKGGDPFVFGRGSEEAVHLVENGISFEVVPGITAAYAGIPLTHRGLAKSLRIITGHRRDDQALDFDWADLADEETTLVIYMGLANIDLICTSLIDGGASPELPAAAIYRGSTADQQRILGTVGTLPVLVAEAAMKSPTLVIIGHVVGLADRLEWYFPQEAAGKKAAE
ncbi:MAG: uroporphyrinogen-III C-methyltransferase [Proteobacteria bacterium]|nr:uroporphyrinogen-III C-methyltransferase [Pseudomonadota bacterium]